MVINVSKAIFKIMYAVWVRARKNGPRLGNKRLSIRVPSFEKEKVEKLAKNTQKAVFITILWTYTGSNCPNLSVKLGLPFTFPFSQDLSEKLPYYTLAGRKREKKAFRCALIINLCVVSLLGLFRGSYISWSSPLKSYQRNRA